MTIRQSFRVGMVAKGGVSPRESDPTNKREHRTRADRGGSYAATPGYLGSAGPSKWIGGAGALGLRATFTPPKIVGFSLFGLLSGGFSKLDSGALEGSIATIQGELGFALDEEIVPGF